MIKGEDSGARMALHTPRSLFNKPVSQHRRLGTQMLSLVTLKEIARKTDTTVNDVLLAVVGGAVRRYLEERHEPLDSLLASVPMGLSRDPSMGGGNAAVGFVVPVGTDVQDPYARLKMISRITRRSKQEIAAMPRVAQSQLALLGLSPFVAGQMMGVLPKLPPMFNFVVSNVVLSKEPLYLMGAELEAVYPVSFLFDGYAINITLVGYTDRVAIGFLGCREAVPSLQRLAVYTRDALAELSAAVHINDQLANLAAEGA